ncbi:MAG: hypothetical protein JRI45_05215 [Deltaproteobacteria bacterium]|nr:hypothetical protein [Deltaproteobacteria bacterium]MBW2068450.1 hypothetical protein [Deltaproteobacteria bacterium]
MVALSNSCVIETIEEAMKLHKRYSTELLSFLGDLLVRGYEATKVSRSTMHSLGIDEICKRCDIEEGGSCCAKGLENYYDSVLLLANLIVGVKLPVKRYAENGCFFLGPDGCVLTFRHTICVNYLCRAIYEKIGHENVVRVQKTCGEEMHLTFLICERIREFLQHTGGNGAEI